MYKKNLTVGEKFGERVVVERTNKRKNGYVLYVVQCPCGRTSNVSGSYLRQYPHRLCSTCSRNKNKKNGAQHHFYRHGQAGRKAGKTPEYNSWVSMRCRCKNVNDSQYKDYGGRGIKVCPEWEDFSAFYADMGSRPVGFQLDRVDNNGHYCKENCRWSSVRENQNNKRTTTIFTIDGKKTPRTELEERIGISREGFRRRLEQYAIETLQQSDLSLEEVKKRLRIFF